MPAGISARSWPVEEGPIAGPIVGDVMVVVVVARRLEKGSGYGRDE